MRNSPLAGLVAVLAWAACLTIPAGAAGAAPATPGPARFGTSAVQGPRLSRLAPGFRPRQTPVSLGDIHTMMSTPAGRTVLKRRAVPADQVAAAMHLAVAPADTQCEADTYIQSVYTEKYVSTELGADYTGDDYGLLRARANTIGPWELYWDCYILNDTGTWVESIMSEANHLWVSTEYGFSYPLYMVLRARASQIGPWEKYYNGYPAYNQWDIQSVYINRYVSVELGDPYFDTKYYAVLRARATEVGDWEIFYKTRA